MGGRFNNNPSIPLKNPPKNKALYFPRVWGQGSLIRIPLVEVMAVVLILSFFQPMNFSVASSIGAAEAKASPVKVGRKRWIMGSPAGVFFVVALELSFL